MKALRGRYSGLCQPTYVLDIPGGYGKAVLSGEAAMPIDAERWEIRDFNGLAHVYPPLA